jgi:hypothetical protein
MKTEREWKRNRVERVEVGERLARPTNPTTAACCTSLSQQGKWQLCYSGDKNGRDVCFKLSCSCCRIMISVGRAIAQAVSRRLSYHGSPGSNPGLVMWDFVMEKSGVRADFLRELRFPLSIYIPSASPQPSSLSPEAGTIGQEWP